MRIAITNSENPTAEEKAEIQKHVQNGTIWDCLIAFPGGGDTSDISRVVAVSDQCIFIIDTSSDAILAVSYAE